MVFRARQHVFHFPRPALVMGVVNVTPDSFYDGGRWVDPQAAVQHGLQLAHEGAEILDVGGESTRPHAEPVSEAEECRRVLPVIEELAKRLDLPISIDTTKPGVAREALARGASLVNDVGANREDDAMWRLVASEGAGYVAMHMQGNPQTMQEAPEYRDVVEEIAEFFSDRLKRLRKVGVDPEQVVLDVGIGFGKTLEHNLRLLGSLKDFKRLGRPLLLGVSRKSFIGRLLGVDAESRLPGSLACACRAWESGVEMVRAHDVAATVQALRMLEAIAGNRV